MNCKIPLCQNKSSSSAIIRGVYYPQICQIHKARLNAGQSVSSGAARWNREIDGQDNAWMVQQPFDREGKPNGEFIRLFPEQARNHFDEETIRKFS